MTRRRGPNARRVHFGNDTQITMTVELRDDENIYLEFHNGEDRVLGGQVVFVGDIDELIHALQFGKRHLKKQRVSGVPTPWAPSLSVSLSSTKK